jgi:hypothetical protein
MQVSGWNKIADCLPVEVLDISNASGEMKADRFRFVSRKGVNIYGAELDSRHVMQVRPLLEDFLAALRATFGRHFVWSINCGLYYLLG